MLWIISIVAFLVIFSLLILIHEFGHFFVARRCGIKVEEFGMGMPPRIWGYKPKKSDTLYSINAIPFGGFVRLYGEDPTDGKAMKSKRSFVHKKPWQKLLVVAAGVIMNLILAYTLLLVGFTVGMQPLLVTPEDVFQAIDSGVVTIVPGLVVKSSGPNDVGFIAGDRILSINGRPVVLGDELDSLKDQEKVIFEVERNGQSIRLNGVNDAKRPFVTLYDLLPLPEVVVKGVGNDHRGGLRPGEILGKINGERIFTVEQFRNKVGAVDEITDEPAGWVEMPGTAIGPEKVAPVVISQVLPWSNAENAGLKEGDEVLSVNGVTIKSPNDLAQAVDREVLPGKAVYTVRRGGAEIEFYVQKNEQGMVGVLLSPSEYLDEEDVNVYARTKVYSVTAIANVSYPFGQAVLESFWEIGRLSVFTVETFVSVFQSIFTRLSVPEGVAGPVGIAQMTFVFVQEGVMSLIRFTALLSLSLAIINILPFPGLDGGRFVLILVPAILGKKLNPRLEAMIHVFGFLLLMLLLFMVTFNDLARLFS